MGAPQIGQLVNSMQVECPHDAIELDDVESPTDFESTDDEGFELVESTVVIDGGVLSDTERAETKNQNINTTIAVIIIIIIFVIKLLHNHFLFIILVIDIIIIKNNIINKALGDGDGDVNLSDLEGEILVTPKARARLGSSASAPKGSRAGMGAR